MGYATSPPQFEHPVLKLASHNSFLVERQGVVVQFSSGLDVFIFGEIGHWKIYWKPSAPSGESVGRGRGGGLLIRGWHCKTLGTLQTYACWKPWEPSEPWELSQLWELSKALEPLTTRFQYEFLLLDFRIRNRPKPAQLAPTHPTTNIGRDHIAFWCWRKKWQKWRNKTYSNTMLKSAPAKLVPRPITTNRASSPNKSTSVPLRLRCAALLSSRADRTKCCWMLKSTPSLCKWELPSLWENAMAARKGCASEAAEENSHVGLWRRHKRVGVQTAKWQELKLAAANIHFGDPRTRASTKKIKPREEFEN